MERMAWKGRIRHGCKAEYVRRHREIWPEMVKTLKDAGICNYSIFCCNDDLFGYYECEKGVAFAERMQAESKTVKRWNEYMKDVLELEMDPVTGAQPKLEQVFRLE
ncbi:MAG: L-rhamnose mutarotase [Clostridia bacterium]|nr:L-rhamnose mutarotase [Clostridia bacterium]